MGLVRADQIPACLTTCQPIIAIKIQSYEVFGYLFIEPALALSASLYASSSSMFELWPKAQPQMIRRNRLLQAVKPKQESLIPCQV